MKDKDLKKVIEDLEEDEIEYLLKNIDKTNRSNKNKLNIDLKFLEINIDFNKLIDKLTK